MEQGVLSTSTLMHDDVKNRNGDKLGTVSEIVLDLDSGRVAYMVMSAGGVFGMGDKLFAIPWSSLAVDLDGHSVIVDVDPEVIENSPGFDKDDWPDMADVTWRDDIHRHYGAEPYWSRTGES